MGIGSRIAYNDTKLEPNMVLSNEPGYYQDGEFGIRIESLVVVRPEKTLHEFGGVKYLGMEHLTMVSLPPFSLLSVVAAACPGDVGSPSRTDLAPLPLCPFSRARACVCARSVRSRPTWWSLR